MKEQEKKPEKNPNETDKEYKAIVIRMLTEWGKRLDEHSENFNKDYKI